MQDLARSYHLLGLTKTTCKNRFLGILRNIPLSKNDLKDLKADCETKINRIKSDLIQIEYRFNARLNENKFYEYNGEQERLLGEIHYNNFLTECRNGKLFCIFSKIKFILRNKNLKGSYVCRSSK